MVLALEKDPFGDWVSSPKLTNIYFYCGNVVFVFYTDDSIIFGPDTAEIHSLINKMKAAGLDLTVEGKL
jgi:hypothetical protein